MLTPEKLRELRHPDWVCDNDAIQQVLDWQPQVQLEEGLRRTPGWCPLLK
jgi:nucleoside-diphosphate-sugar epimerase